MGATYTSFQTLLRKRTTERRKKRPLKNGILGKGARRAALGEERIFEIAAKTRETQLQITEEVEKEHARQDRQVEILAARFNVTERAMKMRLQRSSHFKQKRSVSKYNAWLHGQSLLTNESKSFNLSFNNQLF